VDPHLHVGEHELPALEFGDPAAPGPGSARRWPGFVRLQPGGDAGEQELLAFLDR
jgi:hypothetical protein